MHWQFKANIMKVCATLPTGESIYRFLQKMFGRLKVDPMERIPLQVEIAQWILEMGKKVEGNRFFEVGTGHCPIVPIGLFLCGAEQVVTVDLYKRLDLGILKKTLVWIAENRDKIYGYYKGISERAIFDGRMNIIDKLKHKPEKLLTEANIIYLAPADAANTKLSDSSMDYHISTTVFEHIPRKDIKLIMEEAKRILSKDGFAIHIIDLSDHFHHQDKSITAINFLRYSEEEWVKIAGNQFAYCNRLRASDYLELFEGVGFDVYRQENQEDKEAIKSIRGGFLVDKLFSDYDIDDLITTQLKVALKVKIQGV